MSDLSEFCYLGEVEVAHLHGRDHHIKSFLAAGPHRPSHLFDRFQHVNQALVEAEIPDSIPEFAILNQESTVARHACEDLFVWIDFANIPEPCYEYTFFCGTYHVIDGFFALGPRILEDDIHGRITNLVGKGKSVSSGGDCAELVSPLRIPYAMSGHTRMDQVL